MNRLRRLWFYLKESLWFVPVLMVICSMTAGIILIEIDAGIDSKWLDWLPLSFGAGADGSRGMLTAIAGSMITVASLTFSLTLVAMTQASSQYTSRILRNFMRDRRNQFVLGFFVGIFSYCLVVLRTIRGGDEGKFIPSLAVLFGLILAIASIGVLIFYIHHIANSIQAATIIKRAADDTISAVKRLFPKQLGEEAEVGEEEHFASEIERLSWQLIPSPTTGYIQSVDTEGIIRLAKKRNCIFRMERGIGEFTVKGAPLASFSGGEDFDEKTSEEFTALFVINTHRTIDQDAAFGVRQIVDIALKALSPGINDTTTAAMCVDYLTAILSELARRRIESAYRTENGRLLVVARGRDFRSMVDESFNQIRDAAENNLAIYERLLDSIKTIQSQTASEKRLAILTRHINLIAEDGARTLKSEDNLRRLREKIIETSLNEPAFQARNAFESTHRLKNKGEFRE